MIKKTVLLILLFNVQMSYAQHVKTIDSDKICDPIDRPYHYAVEDVEEFKDSLTLKIQLSEVTNGRKVDNDSFSYTENFKDESSIIQISKDVAMSISIARIVDRGKKYYLYSLNLYKKDGNCWEDQSVTDNWTKCTLGTITSGYGFGNQGTSNYIGFTGNVILK